MRSSMAQHQDIAKLVGAAATRTQLHKRALLLLADLQHGVHDLLSDVLGSHSEAAIRKGAEGIRLLQDHEDRTVGLGTATSRAILDVPGRDVLPEQGLVVKELVQAAQARTDLISRTFDSIDELQLGIEELLDDLNGSLHSHDDYLSLEQADGLGQDAIKLASSSSCGDLMKAAAATCAAAHRWHTRALHAQQAAAASQKLAWQKAMDAAQATAQATEAEKEAELLRIQGQLPQAMLAMRRAGQLRSAAQAAMQESEAAYQEYRELLTEAAEASSKALQVSQHAQQLELLGLKQEADEALNQAFRCQGEYDTLLTRAQEAGQVASQQQQAARQLELQVAELQAAAVAAYAAGDVARGQQLNAEAAALQTQAAAARARSQAAADEAAALLSQAEQLSREAGSAGVQAQELLSSKQRLQGVTAQRHAQRLLQQAAQALGAAQQGHAEADALEELDRTYQEQKAAALARAEELDREGRHEEAAVERAAAASWADLSTFVSSSALAARAEAVRKGKVGAALQRAAALAATGSCGGAAATEAARAALDELMSEERRRAVAQDAARELAQLLRGRAAGGEGGTTPDEAGLHDQEMLTADTEEAQQQAVRLDQQLLLAAEHLTRGRRGSTSSLPPDMSAQQAAAVDSVALEHMAQVIKLGRLGQAWREHAKLARTKADDLLAQAKALELESHAGEARALDLENQARAAAACGQHDVSAELAQRAVQARGEADSLKQQADQLRKQAGCLYQDADVALRHAQTMARSIHTLDESAHHFHEAWQATKVASSHPSPSHTSHTVSGSPAWFPGGFNRQSADAQSHRATSPSIGLLSPQGQAGMPPHGSRPGSTRATANIGSAATTPLSALAPDDLSSAMSPLLQRIQAGTSSSQRSPPPAAHAYRRHTAYAAARGVPLPPVGGQQGVATQPGGGHQDVRGSIVGSLNQWQGSKGSTAARDAVQLDLPQSPALAASLAQRLQVVQQPRRSVHSASGQGQQGRAAANGGDGSGGDDAAGGGQQQHTLASLLHSLPCDLPHLQSPLVARPRSTTSTGSGGNCSRHARRTGDGQAAKGSLMSKWLPDLGRGRRHGGSRSGAGSHTASSSKSRSGAGPGAGDADERSSQVAVVEGIEGIESELVGIRSLMHATGSALQLLEQDAAAQDKAIHELQRRAELAAEEARLAREHVNRLAAGGQDVSEAEMAAQLAEEVAQRSVLLHDIRAHELQATAQQIERLHQKLQHLHEASACFEEAKLAGLAAANAEAACGPAVAVAESLLQQARQAEAQAEEEQHQAAVAQQLAQQLANSGQSLDAAELHMSAQTMESRVQQLLRTAARLRVDAARAAQDADQTRKQAVALQRRVHHLKDLGALFLQLASASSHSAQLIFLHAQILLLSAEMQAEATGLRLQDLEAQLMHAPSDRVHQLAQPHLQDRSKALLAAAAELWELVQDAHQYEVPAVTQLCEQLQRLMAAEERAVLGHEPSHRGSSHTGSDGSLQTEQLGRLVAHGRHVAGLLGRFRDVRQQVAEAIVMQSAGKVRSGSIVRSRALFSTSMEPDQATAAEQANNGADHSSAGSAETGSLHLRELHELETEHTCLRAAIHGTLQAHDLLLSAEQLSCSMMGLPGRLAEEQGRAAELRQQATQLRQSCQPYSTQLAAAEELARSLQAQHQVSQARSASNAVGLLLSKAEASIKAANAAEQLAQQADARCQRIQSLLDTLDQVISMCVRQAGVLDQEAGIHASQAQVTSADQKDEQQIRLRVLAGYKQRLQAVLAALRQLCLVHEQAVDVIANKAQEDAEALLKDLDRQAKAASTVLATCVRQLQGSEAAAHLLEQSDRHLAQAEVCRVSAARCQQDIPGLQDAAAQAQLRLLRQLATAEPSQQSPDLAAQQLAAQAAADVTSWRSDAVQLQQMVLMQGVKPLIELSRLALEAARAQLEAVEADNTQVAGPTSTSAPQASDVSDHQHRAREAAQAAVHNLQIMERQFAGKLSLLQLAQEVSTAVEAHAQAEQAVESAATDAAQLERLRADAQLAAHRLFKAMECARGKLAVQAAEDQVAAAVSAAGGDEGIAVQQAKASLAYQQAHAQLALSHSLTHVADFIRLATDEATTCMSEAQAEAAAAGQQAQEYYQSVRDCLAAGRLGDAVAARYAASRAANRSTELQHMHQAWQATADRATQHAGHLHSAQLANQQLQAVVSAAQVAVTAPNSGADADHSDQHGGGRQLLTAESTCKHVTAITQLRLDAAGSMQQDVQGLQACCLAQANSAAVAREAAACERAAELAAAEGDMRSAQHLTAQAREARDRAAGAGSASSSDERVQQAQVLAWLDEAAAEQDLALLHYHLLHLGQDKAELRFRVLLPCKALVHDVHSGLDKTQQHGKDSASQLAGVHHALDRCKSAANAAPHGYQPLYQAKSALLQSQLVQVTEQLLGHDQHVQHMKHHRDRAQLQLDVAEAAYALRSACCEMINTALRCHASSKTSGQESNQPAAQTISMAVSAQNDDRTTTQPAAPLQSQLAPSMSAHTPQSIASLALKHLDIILGLTRDLTLDTDSLAAPSGSGLLAAESKVSKGWWSRSQARFHAAQLLSLAAGYVGKLLEAVAAIPPAPPQGHTAGRAAARLVELRMSKVHNLEHLLHQIYHQLQLTAAAMARRRSSADHVLPGSPVPLHVMTSRVESLAALLGHMMPPWLQACQAAEAAARCALDKSKQLQAETDAQGGDGRRLMNDLEDIMHQVDAHQQLAAAIFEELQLQLELATSWLPDDTLPPQPQVALPAPADLQPALTHQAAAPAGTSLPQGVAGALGAGSGAEQGLRASGNLGRVSRQTEEVARSSNAVSPPVSARDAAVAAARASRATDAQRSSLGHVSQIGTEREGLLGEDDESGSDHTNASRRRNLSTHSEQRDQYSANRLVEGHLSHQQQGAPSAPHRASFGLLHNRADGAQAGGSGGATVTRLPQVLPHHTPHASPRYGSMRATDLDGSGIPEPSFPASPRTPLPAHMSPEQAHILLTAWQHRCHLIHRALHVTHQLRQLAAQQLKEAETAMSKVESGGLQQTAEGGAAGVGPSSWAAARQQLSAAQTKVKESEAELTRFQQELREAEGMVERLCLHCCSQYPAPPRSVLLAFRGANRTRLQPDQKLGSLSPAAAAALKRSASNLNLGRCSLGDPTSPYRHANITPKVTLADLKLGSRLDRTGVEPWTGLHDPYCDEACTLSDTAASDVDPRPGLLMHQVLTTSGLVLDESPGGLLNSKVPGGTDPLEETILAKGQAAAWLTTTLSLQQQEQVLAGTLTMLKQQEAEVLLQARAQSAKASEILMQDTKMLPSATRATPLTQRLHLGTDSNDSAVRHLQAERYHNKSDALSSWAASVGSTAQELVVLQARLQSDVHALSRAQSRLTEAGAMELAALRCHKEAAELVCQALTLAVEHTAATTVDLGRCGLSGLGLPGLLLNQPPAVATKHEIFQAIQALHMAARERSEASLKSRSAGLQHGQHACDAYLTALSNTAERLQQVAAALERHADKLSAQHVAHVQQQEECAEKATQASRAGLKATASGSQELGVKLSKAADKWRTCSISAGAKTAACLQEMHQLRQDAKAMHATAEQLQAQGRTAQQRLSKALDAMMRDVLSTTRALALAAPNLVPPSSPIPPPQRAYAPPLPSIPKLLHSPEHPLHTSYPSSVSDHPGVAARLFTGDGSPALKPGCSQQVHHPGDAAAERLTALHDKLQRLEQQVAMNKRMAVADARIAASAASSSPAHPSVHPSTGRSSPAGGGVGEQLVRGQDVDLRQIGRDLKRLGGAGGETAPQDAVIRAFRGSCDAETASRVGFGFQESRQDVCGEGDTAKRVVATRERLRSILNN